MNKFKFNTVKPKLSFLKLTTVRVQNGLKKSLRNKILLEVFVISSKRTVSSNYFIHRFSNVWSQKRIQVFACRSLHVLIQDGRHLSKPCGLLALFRGGEGGGNCATKQKLAKFSYVGLFINRKAPLIIFVNEKTFLLQLYQFFGFISVHHKSIFLTTPARKEHNQTPDVNSRNLRETAKPRLPM